MTKCNECIHKLVCKFTEEYQEVEKKFLETKEEKFYKTDLKCKYFEACNNYWPKEINLCKTEKHSICDDCWLTKKLEDGGIYVGDYEE